jgi:hypothetical protein
MRRSPATPANSPAAPADSQLPASNSQEEELAAADWDA